MQSYYLKGKVKLISEAELSDSIINEKDNIVTFMIPFVKMEKKFNINIWSDKSNMILFKQVLINTKTDQICGNDGRSNLCKL